MQLLDGEFDAEAAGGREAQRSGRRRSRALRDVLSGTTIADVVQQEDQAAGAQMYHI